MRVLITGATRGLGLAAARAVAENGGEVVVAGRDAEAVTRVAAEIHGEPLLLDLASPIKVRESAAQIGATVAPVDAVVGNAGVQLVAGPTFTADGVEETLAVNVLGHVALIDELLTSGRLAAAESRPRVVFLGSSTHDPAKTTGIPAPAETLDLAALARGELTTSGRQRYSTSKLHCTALTSAYARAYPTIHWTCFDPGLMPGTGLARDYAAWQRALWTVLGPALLALPFASSPGRSGRALARVVSDDPPPAPSGSVVDFRLRETRPSERAADPSYQNALLAQYRQLAQQPSASS
jgi:NAD(P)-dependent dehydrogenase (short-subunit alcohol dehydrogenase family)